MIRNKLFAVLLLGGVILSFAAGEDDVCVFRKGAVVYEVAAEEVDSIAVAEGNITLFNKAGAMLYATPHGNVDSIRFLPSVPRADILDVMFTEDGSAVDLSPLANVTHKNGIPSCRFSYRHNRYAAHFNNPWAGTGSNYFRINYESRAVVKNALADGHTLEALVRAEYDGVIADKEAKFFTSHQSGGTGLMVCTKANGKNKRTELAFLPSVSTNGANSWKYTPSGIEPVSGQYYHVVGVWNQEEGTSKIYVDGQLKNTVPAVGNLHFPAVGCNWFGIGADPAGNSSAHMAWNGDVGFVRIYDAPLDASQVKSLYERTEILSNPHAKDFIQNVKFYSGLNVTAGSSYILYGTGFEDGDIVTLTDILHGNKCYTAGLQKENSSMAGFILPADFVTGLYRMVIQRGEMKQDIGLNQFNVVQSLPRGAKVIAHRGFWTTGNASQNSRASLRQAFDNNFFGAETDIWITADDSLVVNHDATLGGIRLDTSTYEQVKGLALSNGERLPRLREFLQMLRTATTQTKLVIEIKTHGSTARNMAAAAATVKMVEEMNVKDQVEYIAFNYDICKKIVELDPKATVGFLCGSTNSIKTPQELYRDGISGLAYTRAVMASHPDFISQAHELGLIVKVWTVDVVDEIIDTNNSDYDEILTNYPDEAQWVYNYYLKNNTSKSDK